MHEHGATSPWVVHVIPVLVVLFLAIAYVAAALRNRQRRPWPAHRSVLWVGGLVVAGVAVAGPLPDAAHRDFPAHMAGHVLLGMLAPLLLVLSAPITLALRSMDPVPARRLSALLKSPVIRFLVHPVTAAILDIGGLWVLYTTALFPAMHTHAVVLLAVQVHVFTAGYLFTASMIGIDPSPHRAGHLLRGAIMVLALAGHDILAKHLYGHPPLGVPADQAETGALVMYYAGDLVELVVIIVLCTQWFHATRPRAFPGRGTGRLESCP